MPLRHDSGKQIVVFARRIGAARIVHYTGDLLRADGASTAAAIYTPIQ